MIAGLAMAALGLGSFAPFPQPWTYLPLTLASFGLGVFCVSSLAYLNECVTESLKATISGSYYLSWGLGYFLGPLMVGQLGETVSPQAGYYLLALLMAVQTGALCLCPPISNQQMPGHR
jgi:MFS family permease